MPINPFWIFSSSRSQSRTPLSTEFFVSRTARCGHFPPAKSVFLLFRLTITPLQTMQRDGRRALRRRRRSLMSNLPTVVSLPTSRRRWRPPFRSLKVTENRCAAPQRCGRFIEIPQQWTGRSVVVVAFIRMPSRNEFLCPHFFAGQYR